MDVQVGAPQRVYGGLSEVVDLGDVPNPDDGRLGACPSSIAKREVR
jgi:hypothetical protein